MDEVSWNADEVVMLAHLIGDGCVASGQPLPYTSADEENVATVAGAARHFGISARLVRQGSWTHVYLPAPQRLARGRRNPIASWLDGMGLYGLRAHEKFLPRAVHALPGEQLRLFVRHLWATDGSVTTSRSGGVRIYYATTSRRLALDVQQLLLRLDIRSRVRTVTHDKHRTGFTVDISGVIDQRRFLEDVGVHGSRRLQVAAALERLAGVRSNPNVDTIPLDVWGHVRLAASSLGLADRGLQAAVGSAYCGSTFYRHAPSRPWLKTLALALESPELHDTATSDVFWDSVTGVVALGPQPTYDATVLDTHNFIANGIVAHNSIEQDADVVIFLYRDGEQNPDAEVELVKAKVAKHRNGPIGEVPLQFRKANTRFYTVAAREEIAAY
jgi:replicative DNA helicase